MNKILFKKLTVKEQVTARAGVSTRENPKGVDCVGSNPEPHPYLEDCAFPLFSDVTECGGDDYIPREACLD